MENKVISKKPDILADHIMCHNESKDKLLQQQTAPKALWTL